MVDYERDYAVAREKQRTAKGDDVYYTYADALIAKMRLENYQKDHHVTPTKNGLEKNSHPPMGEEGRSTIRQKKQKGEVRLNPVERTETPYQDSKIGPCCICGAYTRSSFLVFGRSLFKCATDCKIKTI